MQRHSEEKATTHRTPYSDLHYPSTCAWDINIIHYSYICRKQYTYMSKHKEVNVKYNDKYLYNSPKSQNGPFNIEVTSNPKIQKNHNPQPNRISTRNTEHGRQKTDYRNPPKPKAKRQKGKKPSHPRIRLTSPNPNQAPRNIKSNWECLVGRRKRA